MTARATLVCVLVGLLGAVACAALTPADQVEISNTAAILAKCQTEGRACKADGGLDCYGVYEACVHDGGL